MSAAGVVSELSDLERNWFHSTFMSFSIRTTGNAWESFITDAMSALHGGDYQPVDAAGRGDKGCDGYVNGLMLAAYGASSPEQARTTKKVNADFAKALDFWGQHMDRWAFVHNNASGLPAMATQAVLDLRRQHAGKTAVQIESWTPQVFWKECVSKLQRADLAYLFGAIPTDRPAGMPYIIECVKSLARTRLTPGLDEVLPVPPGKVEFNSFTAETAELVIRAQAQTGHVRHYFRYAPPGESYQVSESLRSKYAGLMAMLSDADLVFHALINELVDEAFASDKPGDLDQRRDAALLVVTHFFEGCVIFARPSDVAS